MTARFSMQRIGNTIIRYNIGLLNNIVDLNVCVVDCVRVERGEVLSYKCQWGSFVD